MSRSVMETEIREIPQAAARLLSDGAPAIEAAAAAIRFLDPGVIVTVARGSSDHAASYFKYACELVTGVPVASVGPSVASIYARRLRLDGQVLLAISQSGRSPDLVEMQRSCREGGATAIAITNDPGAPLGQGATHCVDICAGPERAVAATKSYVNSVIASLAVVSEWSGDAALRDGIARLPEAMDRALDCDWSALAERLAPDGSFFVLGRGPGYAVAGEVALKFKEICGLHAEAHSAAEVLHGPAALLEAAFPVLALAADDAALPQIRETAERLAGQGADVFLTAPARPPIRALPALTGLHPLVAPLALAPAAYLCVEAIARRRGADPDHPRHLSKVTKTL